MDVLSQATSNFDLQSLPPTTYIDSEAPVNGSTPFLFCAYCFLLSYDWHRMPLAAGADDLHAGQGQVVETEVEALKAIYTEDFSLVLCKESAWDVAPRPEYRLVLGSRLYPSIVKVTLVYR